MGHEEFLGVVYELFFEPDYDAARSVEPGVESFVLAAESALSRDPTSVRLQDAGENVWVVRSAPGAYDRRWALFYTFDAHHVFFLALQPVPF